MESTPPQRPPRPPLPAVDASTPVGRAVAGFYLAFEAVDHADRIREAANWPARQGGAGSREKYLALAHGITTVEQIRGRARSRLRELGATATRTAQFLAQCSVDHPSDIDAAVNVALRHEETIVGDTAVRQINAQTRAVLDLDETTAAVSVHDWLTRHGLRHM
ncbi:hypothetical protein BI330_19480 [Mycobacterium sp. CBMA 623]|nr:hypothetical protein [Mycobacteroides sp. CBMA 326]